MVEPTKVEMTPQQVCDKIQENFASLHTLAATAWSVTPEGKHETNVGPMSELLPLALQTADMLTWLHGFLLQNPEMLPDTKRMVEDRLLVSGAILPALVLRLKQLCDVISKTRIVVARPDQGQPPNGWNPRIVR